MYSNDYEDMLPCGDNLKADGADWLDKQVKAYLGVDKASAEPSKVLHCPNEIKGQGITTSYGLNYLIATGKSGAIKTTVHKQPSGTSLLVENYGHLCYYGYALNETGIHSSTAKVNRAPFFRHKRNTRCTAAFLDGHCTQLKKKSVPCREAYPDRTENAIINTIFNMGIVDSNTDTIQGL